MGSRDAGAIEDLPWDPAVLAGPHPPNLDTPLLVAPESPVCTLRFLLQRLHHRLLGGGGGAGGMGGRGGVVHLDKPLRRGVVKGWWRWQQELPGPGKRWGEVRPPRKWGEDVQVGANQLLHSREEKGAGHPLATSPRTSGMGWAWGGWSMWGRP